MIITIRTNDLMVVAEVLDALSDLRKHPATNISAETEEEDQIFRAWLAARGDRLITPQ